MGSISILVSTPFERKNNILIIFHPDVVEPDADPTGQNVGSKLIVDGQQFSDLDELIVNHVQAMARKVEELMMHEKFKPGSEDELRKLFVLAIMEYRLTCLKTCS